MLLGEDYETVICTMTNEAYQVVNLFKHRFYEWSSQRLLEEVKSDFRALKSVKNINSYSVKKLRVLHLQ